MDDLSDHINQSGITFGPRKLELMKEACRLRDVPLSSANLDADGNTISDLLRVKLFNPCGHWTWYVQDWDGSNICFGYVQGDDDEWGSFSLSDLAEIKGPLGLGIEIDVYFKPTKASEIAEKH